MLEIGTIPIDFTLDQYNSGTATLSSYNGKIISLSFMDIDNDWDWLKNLISIKNNASFTGTMQIIVVIYKYNGGTSKDDIQEKIDNDPGITDADITFPLLVDNTWSTISFAYQYLNQGFGGDSYFSNSFSNYFSSFLISKDNVISDKWNKNCTTNSDPISFNKIIIPSIPVFNSQDYGSTDKYLLQRLINLDASPAILYTTPVEGTELTSLSSVEVVYSKLMVDAAATAGNYTPGGTGVGTLSVTGTSYTGTDRIENVATLTTSGTLVDGELAITLSNITDTEGNALTDAVINYPTNPTAPSIASWTSAGTIANGGTVQVTFSEDVSNATNTDNYVVNYAGTGSVSIQSISYNSGTRTAELTMSLALTNGATFTIETVTGSSPITDGTHTLANGTSPLYSTADLVAPTVTSWTASGQVSSGGVITVQFSDNVVNADNISNYQVNYSGPGTVTITGPISYDSGAFTAALTMSISGTDGTTFTIETVTGASPISDGTNNLTNGTSNTYLTADEIIPTITGWSPSGTVNNGDTVYVQFSENVSNANRTDNYQVNHTGAGTVGIQGVTYDSGTHRATLTVTVSGTDGSSFTIETITGSSPISDGTNTLVNGTSNTYTTVDASVPMITGWSASGLINNGSSIYVEFSEDVQNAANINNYVVNFTGTGNISITPPVLYDSGTRRAVLTIAIANATGGENFTIGTQTGPSPITDGTNNLVNGTSNTYITPDLAQPAIVSWSTPGIINNGDIISVTFSENVNNSQNPDNYRINYSGPGSITMNNSISYNSGTFTASLPMALSGTDGSTFTIETVTGTTPIQDNNGNTLINGVSGTYTSAVIDVNVPIITQFQLTSANPSSSQDITFNLTGSDNVAITSWMVNESATPPSASDPAWVATKPTAYTLSNGYGTKNVYAWAKDAAGNVSIVNSNSHFSVQYANIIPAITEFLLMSMPSQSEDIAIGLRDNNANSWLINESPATPSPTDPNWLGSVPESYSLSSGNGVKTVYAWAMNDFNAKSNITSALTDASHFNVGINIPQNFDQLALMLIDDSVGNTYNTDIYPYSTFDLGSYHTAGVSKRYNFRITNQGTGDLNIEQIIDTNGTEPGIYFDQGSFQPISLKSGETYDFHITYSPQYETSFTAVFRIKSNDPDYRDFGFYLTGEGVNNPIIESFSSPNGSSVQNRDITVECDMGGGNYWLVNESITPPPPMQVGDEGWKSYQPQGGYDSQNYTLSPGYGTKKVYAWGVKWDSQAMTCGPVSDLTNSSQFQIELTAANPAPVISVKAFLEKGYVNGITVNPNSTLDTGTITRQEAQEGHWTYFTIQNASAVNNLEVTAITMEMVSGDGFEFTGKPLLPATLAPNTEGLYLSIMFKNSNPPQQAEARITIQNNDPDNENFTFTVTVACSG